MLTDRELSDEMQRLSSMWPRWMTDASHEQTQRFRQLVAEAAKLALKPTQKIYQWRIDCRGKISDFAALRREIETRFTDVP